MPRKIRRTPRRNMATRLTTRFKDFVDQNPKKAAALGAYLGPLPIALGYGIYKFADSLDTTKKDGGDGRRRAIQEDPEDDVPFRELLKRKATPVTLTQKKEFVIPMQPKTAKSKGKTKNDHPYRYRCRI